MSKTIKMGVVGVTGRGGMAKYWHTGDGRSAVVAGMDVSGVALERFNKDVNPDAFTTTNLDELLSRDIDAVAIMSPDYTHEAYALKAFAAGKHVFCEKPLGITIEGCDRMLEAWQKSGKKFMVGFNMRYMNIFRVMKEIVDSGAIGEIKAVWVRHFVCHGGGWYYHDWHGASRNSTGLLLQKASHDIDMIHWITGKYTKRVAGLGMLSYYGGDKPNDLRCPVCPDKDSCVEFHHFDNGGNQMDLCAYRKEVDVEDVSAIMMELDGGIQATYSQCHFAPDYWRNYTFIGTEGRVENQDDWSKVVVKYRSRSKRWKNLTGDEIHEVRRAEGSHGGADPIICRDFLDMITDGKTPVATPLAGRMSVAVGVKGTESIRGGNRMLDIPALPESIAGKVF